MRINTRDKNNGAAGYGGGSRLCTILCFLFTNCDCINDGMLLNVVHRQVLKNISTKDNGLYNHSTL